MITDPCSVWAYHDIKNSGYISDRQAMYLSVFVNCYPYSVTAQQATEQVEKRFGKEFSSNGIGSRLSELERKGFLKKGAKVRCPKTNKLVNTWGYSGRTEPIPTRKERCVCDKCEGSGYIFKETPNFIKENLFN